MLVAILSYSIASAQSPKHQAFAVLRSNSEQIKKAAELFGVHPRVVAGVIFVEQVMNVSWVDRALDVTFANYGFNTSIGMGQVKVETAQWIETALRDSASMYFLGDSLGRVFPLSESRQETVDRLADPGWNAWYVAANLAMILKRWSEAGFPLLDKTDVLATLYSTGVVRDGVEKKKPHSRPIPNQFGRIASQFFHSDILSELFPR